VFTVKIFQPNDIFPVVKLASETLTERYNPSLFNYFYETFNQGFLVAEKHHKIVGFIVGVKTSSEGARILMIAVSEKQRGQNIGSALLNHFLKEIIIQKIKHIELEVKISNNVAIEFYQKHGFIIIDTISKFYQSGEDAYTMRLIL
jgi:[ribosomal protein S18]-alanine N-acetyltransferase